MITGTELKQMDSKEFTKATKNLPLETRLYLAMLAGAKEKGITTYRGEDMTTAKAYHETLDYEGLAKLINEVGKNGI